MTWTTVAAIAHVALATFTSGHVVLYKRDSRAAILWVGLVLLSPVLGTLLYFLLGINRVRRRAQRVRVDPQRSPADRSPAAEAASDELAAVPENLRGLGALVGRAVGLPLLAGNRVEPLVNGDNAYPAMCAAIEAARESVSLSSFIFHRDVAGLRFVRALATAVRQGAEVRVLVDDAGARYSFPKIFKSLAAAGVRTAAFHPRGRYLPKSALNLRNHRKICVVDGRTGFSGGMNIQRAHVLSEQTRKPVRDVHFRIEGPVVRHLQETFIDDWLFATGETVDGERWFPRLEAAGGVIARGIPEGPGSDLDKLRWTVLGAIGAARRSIKIVTPYFLPDATLVTALNMASLRGVQVDIVLPRKPNIVLVRWAVLGTLWQVLEYGCRVWFTPPPFDHSKLMLVDGAWTLLGSANWDPRSFRLNFELNVECYDEAFGQVIDALIEAKRSTGEQVTAARLSSRPLPARLRDGIARLFAPIL